MEIVIVQPGDTLYSIGRAVGLAPGFLARYNGLREPYRLAPGQSLLVLRPERTVQVQPGDTLFSIAAASGQSVLELYRLNPNLSGSDHVYPGQILVTRLEQAKTRPTVVSGYAYPYVQPSVLRGILAYAGILAPFTYGFTLEGALVPMEDEALLALAAAYDVQPYLHLSTLTPDGVFSAAQAAVLLQSPALQQTLADAVIARMQEAGYAGLDVDFEYLGAELAESYAAFLRYLHTRLAPLGLPLIAALAPKTSAGQKGTLYEGHDYTAIGAACDAALLMTYEWGYTYGPPMAVAPVNAVRRVVEFAVSQIPPQKLLLGFPNYAYDWTLPFTPGQTRAQLIGNEAAPLLAARYGVPINYDETAQTPYFSYLDAMGQAHEVWFEDARSARAKFALLEEFGLLGLGYWNFMRPFTAGFSLQNYLFSAAQPALTSRGESGIMEASTRNGGSLP